MAQLINYRIGVYLSNRVHKTVLYISVSFAVSYMVTMTPLPGEGYTWASQSTGTIRPGKERAIHESCTQDLALRCACRPSWASGHVSS